MHDAQFREEFLANDKAPPHDPEGCACSEGYALCIVHRALRGGRRQEAASHLPVPVLRLRVDRAEDFQVPLAAAPGFDDFRSDDVDEDLREGTAVRIAVEVVRWVIPAERWEKDERQEQVEAVVDHEQLPAGALYGRVVDE